MLQRREKHPLLGPKYPQESMGEGIKTLQENVTGKRDGTENVISRAYNNVLFLFVCRLNI